MLKRLMDRRSDEEGFTLIELMVVVLIIGILIAIALPTFLGARERAQNRAAQSDLRNTIAAAKTLYTDASSYLSSTTTGLDGVEPSLNYVTAASTSTNTFSVSVATGNVSGTDSQIFGAARLSASGDCYHLTDISAGANAGTYRNEDATCTGANAITFTVNDNTW